MRIGSEELPAPYLTSSIWTALLRQRGFLRLHASNELADSIARRINEGALRPYQTRLEVD